MSTTSSESWIQPLLSKVPWLEPAALEVTAVCSEGFTPLTSAKLCTMIEERSTLGLCFVTLGTGLVTTCQGLVLPSSGRKAAYLQATTPVFHLVQAFCKLGEHPFWLYYILKEEATNLVFSFQIHHSLFLLPLLSSATIGRSWSVLACYL